MIQPSYPCKQAELYTAARIGWRNFLNQLPAFTSYKPFYTNAYHNNRLLEITAAETMADESVRRAKVKSKHLILTQKAELARNRWQDIKSYINSAFTDAELEIKYQEAGAAHYPLAAANNWEETELLLVDGETFLAANLAALTAGNNMPPAFVAQYAAAKNAFITAMSDFYNQEELESDVAEDKIIANNAIYDKLLEMCIDGQKIFRTDLAKKQMFTFDDLLSLVTNHVANLKGSVTTGIASTPVPDAKVDVLQLAEFTTTDTDGKYDFGSIANGTYTIVFSKAGFITQTFTNIIIETGTAKTINVVLLPE